MGLARRVAWAKVAWGVWLQVVVGGSAAPLPWLGLDGEVRGRPPGVAERACGQLQSDVGALQQVKSANPTDSSKGRRASCCRDTRVSLCSCSGRAPSAADERIPNNSSKERDFYRRWAAMVDAMATVELEWGNFRSFTN